jgi:hypothetical protein
LDHFQNSPDRRVIVTHPILMQPYLPIEDLPREAQVEGEGGCIEIVTFLLVVH